ncbi:DUF2243 domain-containing protein [Nonomuraea sp. LPB2021202275-12-8]|uniref:DUF2243 domain-containing protein n=1 Tax=Nonomuraea sp. LPB2021202275-12-8 TaxID=3120159 RepID=UPI00300C0CB9
MTTAAEREQPTRRRIALPGALLGVGLGGFADGVVLHQILRWHHVLSGAGPATVNAASVPRMNTVWDGLFHALAWLATLIGLGLLYSRVTRSRERLWSSRSLWGWMLIGWGLFTLVECAVGRQVPGIHHVRTGPDQLWWDAGFLLLGTLLVAGGWLLRRGGAEAEPCREP